LDDHSCWNFIFLFSFFKHNLDNSESNSDTQHDVCKVEDREVEYSHIDEVSHASIDKSVDKISCGSCNQECRNEPIDFFYREESDECSNSKYTYRQNPDERDGQWSGDPLIQYRSDQCCFVQIFEVIEEIFGQYI